MKHSFQSLLHHGQGVNGFEGFYEDDVDYQSDDDYFSDIKVLNEKQELNFLFYKHFLSMKNGIEESCDFKSGNDKDIWPEKNEFFTSAFASKLLHVILP